MKQFIIDSLWEINNADPSGDLARKVAEAGLTDTEVNAVLRTDALLPQPLVVSFQNALSEVRKGIRTVRKRPRVIRR
jgi:hypothetical protein